MIVLIKMETDLHLRCKVGLFSVLAKTELNCAAIY